MAQHGSYTISRVPQPYPTAPGLVATFWPDKKRTFLELTRSNDLLVLLDFIHTHAQSEIITVEFDMRRPKDPD